MPENQDCSDVLAFWQSLHLVGLSRQLLCVLGSIEDTAPHLHNDIRGIRAYLAEGLEPIAPDAAAVLRQDQRETEPTRAADALARIKAVRHGP